MAEEAVGRNQSAVLSGRQEILVVQPSKRKQSAAMTDPGNASAMQSLQALHQKLDVANAAWSQFNVERRFAKTTPVQFLANAFARDRHCFDAREIESCGINERLDNLQQLTASLSIACGDTRFDEHLQFPVARACLIIFLRAVEGNADLAETAVRPQPQVNAITHALRRIRGKQFGVLIGNFFVEFLVRNLIW